MGLAKAIRLTNGGEKYGITAACEGSVTDTSDSKNPHKKNYRIESSGGSALDWFYHELKVKYSYQIKLRDTGSYGFLLPAQNIVPTGKEMFAAMKYMGNFLLGNKGIEMEEGGEQGIQNGRNGAKSGTSNPGRSKVDDLMIGDDTDDDEDGEWDMDFELRRRRKR